jgi:hypothetical protein
MRQLFVIGMFVVLIGNGFGSLAHAISITVYTDRSNWESALSGNYTEEDFSDMTLNPGLSVVSDVGEIRPGIPAWWDRVTRAGNETTTFSFSPSVVAFGGFWDLAGPAGPGQGVEVTLPGISGEPLLSIARTFSGGFWGFISDTAFTDVTLQAWNQHGRAETFKLKKLVYSSPTTQMGPIPEPTTILLVGSGLGGILLWRARQRSSIKNKKPHPLLR